MMQAFETAAAKMRPPQAERKNTLKVNNITVSPEEAPPEEPRSGVPKDLWRRLEGRLHGGTKLNILALGLNQPWD